MASSISPKQSTTTVPSLMALPEVPRYVHGPDIVLTSPLVASSMAAPKRDRIASMKLVSAIGPKPPILRVFKARPSPHNPLWTPPQPIWSSILGPVIEGELMQETQSVPSVQPTHSHTLQYPQVLLQQQVVKPQVQDHWPKFSSIVPSNDLIQSSNPWPLLTLETQRAQSPHLVLAQEPAQQRQVSEDICPVGKSKPTANTIPDQSLSVLDLNHESFTAGAPRDTQDPDRSSHPNHSKSSNRQPTKVSPPSSLKANPLGSPIEVERLPELSPKRAFQCINNCRTFISYNLVKDDETTIIVPGYPPTFSRLEFPSKVKNRNKILFTAKDDRRRRSMSDFFTALEVWPWVQPGSLRGINIITDASSFKKLFNFHALPGKHVAKLDIDVEFICGSLVMVDRKSRLEALESAARLFLDVGDGYPRDLGHWRAVQYELGDMRWVVRYRADAWFEGNKLGIKGKEAPETEVISKQDTKAIIRGREVRPGSVVSMIPKAIGRPTLQVPRKHNEHHTTSEAAGLIAWIQQAGELCQAYTWKSKVVGYEMLDPHYDIWETKHQQEIRSMTDLFKGVRDVILEDQKTAGAGTSKYTLRGAFRHESLLKLYRADTNGMDMTDEIKSKFWGPKKGG
ncbi:hypothetical protein VTL71DRAFT_6939 [Oculimacula yallundae]|uniref:Uncharacterized protein n=1 Tax=Oculimacula yallundae TaxID=86028 RepID=A0ABR4BW35_9HELO